jgi:hypothetical protein
MTESSAEYLEKVEQELKKREQLLNRLNKEVSEIEYRLRQRSERRKFLDGNALKMSSADSYRRQLRTELAKKEKERDAARVDVEKARERRDMVKAELSQA